MHPTLFLDIDGVLHAPRSGKNATFDYGLNDSLAKEKNDPGFKKLNIYFTNMIVFNFDQEACTLIKSLVDEFHADIVLTSSWRRIYSKKELYYLFKILDMEYAFVGVTRNETPRKLVIQQYIQEHHIQDYLVIDDQDMTLEFSYHQIRTVNSFTKKDYIKARNLLEVQHV